MKQCNLMGLFVLLIPILLSACASKPAFADANQGLLALYRFNDNAIDSTFQSQDMTLQNTSYGSFHTTNPSLILNGIYHYCSPPSPWADMGYEAIATVPGVNFDAITLSVDFLPTTWGDLKDGISCGYTDTILVMGDSYRWLRLEQVYDVDTERNNLRLSFNNGFVSNTFTELPDLTLGVWHTVSVSVDFLNSTINVNLDGTPSGEVAISPPIVLNHNYENNVMFTDYSSADTFEGYVDNLMVYNRALSVAELEEIGDIDGDLVPDGTDNCPLVANPGQEDTNDDVDGVGDACDNCPDNYNPTQEDVCDSCADLGGDTDGDGICDADDNCIYDPNPEQADSDNDDLGDVCEQDKGIMLTHTILAPTIPIPAGASYIPVTLAFAIDVAEPIRMFRLRCDTITYAMTNSEGEDMAMRDVHYPALGIPTDLVYYNPGDVITLTCNLGDHISPELLTPEIYTVTGIVTQQRNDPDYDPVTKGCVEGVEENDCEKDIFVGMVTSIPTTITVADGVGASLVVQTDRHTVGRKLPHDAKKKGISGIEMGVFVKGKGTCASGYGNSWQNYPDIWRNCAAAANRVTDAEGQAMFTPLSTAYNYIVIGKYNTVDENGNPYTLYGGASVGELEANTITKKYIQFIVTALGEKVPAKYKKITVP